MGTKEHSHLFIDLETTGVEDDCLPLEIGAILVNDNFEIVGRYNSIVCPCSTFDEVHAKLSPFVRNMHQESGLLNDLKKMYENGSWVSAQRAAVDWDISQWLREAGAKAGSLVAVGYSVQVDRDWVSKHFPMLDWVMSHQILDLTSIRKFLNASGYKHLKKFEVNEGNPHRALPDCAAALKEFMFVRGLVTCAKGEHDLAEQSRTAKYKETAERAAEEFGQAWEATEDVGQADTQPAPEPVLEQKVELPSYDANGYFTSEATLEVGNP